MMERVGLGLFTPNAQFVVAGMGGEEDQELTNELSSLGRSAEMGALVAVVAMRVLYLAGESREIFGM